MTRRWIAIAAWLSVLGSCGFANAATYSLTDLGTLGGASSYARGINNAGQIVGYADTGNGASHAFLYDESNGIQDLHAHPLIGASSRAYGINDFGRVVGSYDGPDGTDHAFLYDSLPSPDSELSDLTYSTANSFSGAYGINASGQVVGFQIYGTGNIAFLYDEIDGMSLLGTIPGGSYSYARDVNDIGQVVGYAAANGNGGNHAFLSGEDSLQDLGTLGGSQSYAFGINNFGQIVGGADTTNGEHHAVLYGLYGDLNVDLGTLGGDFARAYEINELGQIVGYSHTGNGESRAFFYDLNNGGVMTDLNFLIEPDLGWVLTDAWDINELGQIVGTGLYEGQARAYLLTPTPTIAPVPEPATLAIWGVFGGLGLIVARRRKRAA